MNTIPKNIKRLRQKKSLTQEELGEKLFVTRQAVSNWETGKNQPDVDMLKSLAEVLEVDIKEVIYGPAPNEDQHRKKMVAAVLCLLAVAAWGIFALLWDEAMIRRELYDIRLSMWLLLALRPLAFCLTGAAIPALISVWRDLHPAEGRVRRCMLAAGAAILVAYLFGVWGMYRDPWINYYWSLWVGKSSWTFLIPGALLFCGTRRKAG